MQETSTNMNLINKVLMSFRSCFTRQAAHTWFIIIILTFILRKEKYGVTDAIRSIGLPENCYESLTHFFKADSWNIEDLSNGWTRTVFDQDETYRINENCIFIIDATKISKEGKCMPAVKRMHQESENSGKGQYIYGHMHGTVGLAVGSEEKIFSVPISSRIHDGMNTILGWQQKSTEDNKKEQADEKTEEKKLELPKHPSKMIKQAYEGLVASGEKQAFCTGDRYYHGVPVLQTLNELNETSEQKLILVTKARSTATAYEDPPVRKKGTLGRSRLKGDAVKLMKLFDTCSKEFKTSTIKIYGKQRKVKYLVVDLLWGQGHYQKLRFVLVMYNGRREILVCTDLTMDALTIIKVYSVRFKIECSFKYLKGEIGAFDYHFWSKSTPRLNRYSKKTDPDPLEAVMTELAKQNIIKTIGAYEVYTLCGCIALGILQLNSLQLHDEFGSQKFGYKRTHSSGYASEANMKNILSEAIISVLICGDNFPITKLISTKIQARKREYYTFELDSA